VFNNDDDTNLNILGEAVATGWVLSVEVWGERGYGELKDGKFGWTPHAPSALCILYPPPPPPSSPPPARTLTNPRPLPNGVIEGAYAERGWALHDEEHVRDIGAEFLFPNGVLVVALGKAALSTRAALLRSPPPPRPAIADGVRKWQARTDLGFALWDLEWERTDGAAFEWFHYPTVELAHNLGDAEYVELIRRAFPTRQEWCDGMDKYWYEPPKTR
jgi:hypothetical protein